MGDATPDRSLDGRRVLVGLGGGIACYKVATLVSRLVQRGAAVRCVMTQAATRFLGPVTLQSLSGRPVITSAWDRDEHPESQHIGLARWADLMVIAPATADLIGKLAHGLCDDAVSLAAAALPRDPERAALQTPLLLAPAMNADMWANPAVQHNVAAVRDVLGATLVGPESGWQACRTSGAGRMSEPEAILEAIGSAVPSPRHQDAKTPR